ncbi:hypothetical protein QE363_001776 [Sphingomonas sp. SORGH_AS870]|uniref:hypothetical protein n=1 Tax=Sphingomonas sp. SORGH_AS_0870 TaxID=3041801 RepID=UPI00285F33DA|nr:hypothetical protein [Sphingomonas sp. SORGH_AS_0870]MDR6145983.1 hypothetical protein [Sphingomonas sp. SORGH_AS_0870]
MTPADQSLAIREIAGKRARDEARMLNRLVENMRLASFRSYLAVTMDSMSAIVPEVLALAGSNVPDAMQRLRPGHRWPSITTCRAGRDDPGSVTGRRIKAGAVCPWRPEPLIAEAIVCDGIEGPFVEVKVYGASLEVKLRGEGFVFFTHGGMGFVMLERLLPETVINSCVGHLLLDVIEHPLFGDRDFIISQSAQVRGGSSLAFDVGRTNLEVPWRS